eukprot:760789-Hanusia_phi.AAC.6
MSTSQLQIGLSSHLFKERLDWVSLWHDDSLSRPVGALKAAEFLVPFMQSFVDNMLRLDHRENCLIFGACKFACSKCCQSLPDIFADF